MELATVITGFPQLHPAATVSCWVHIGGCNHRYQYLVKNADVELSLPHHCHLWGHFTFDVCLIQNKMCEATLSLEAI